MGPGERSVPRRGEDITMKLEDLKFLRGVAQAMPMGVLLCDRMGFKEFYRIQPHILETV